MCDSISVAHAAKNGAISEDTVVVIPPICNYTTVRFADPESVLGYCGIIYTRCHTVVVIPPLRFADFELEGGSKNKRVLCCGGIGTRGARGQGREGGEGKERKKRKERGRERAKRARYSVGRRGKGGGARSGREERQEG